jgi:hypothetical protein
MEVATRCQKHGPLCETPKRMATQIPKGIGDSCSGPHDHQCWDTSWGHQLTSFESTHLISRPKGGQ